MEKKEEGPNIQHSGSSHTASLAASIADDVRWAAVLARDPAADADFVYAVKTTGVYCRPSSSARLPKRENVVFFSTARDAEAAGYRPSRRPAGDRTASAARHAALVAEACRLIESVETELSLDELADNAGMSAFHFHRVFKAETGLTPKEYAATTRAKRIREQLSESRF